MYPGTPNISREVALACALQQGSATMQAVGSTEGIDNECRSMANLAGCRLGARLP